MNLAAQTAIMLVIALILIRCTDDMKDAERLDRARQACAAQGGVLTHMPAADVWFCRVAQK